MRGLSAVDREILEQCLPACDHDGEVVPERELPTVNRLITERRLAVVRCAGCGDHVLATTGEGREALRIAALVTVSIYA